MKNKIKLIIITLTVSIISLFHINSYYKIKEELNLELNLIQYLNKDIYSRYFPPFFSAIICGHLKINEDQLKNIKEKINKMITIEKSNHPDMDISISFDYIDDFKYESSFWHCNIDVQKTKKESPGDLTFIDFQEHDRRTKQFTYKIINIVINESKKEIWFTIN